MPLTLKRKIRAGVILIVTIGLVSMLIVYSGLASLQETVHRLTDIQAPAAAYEMEINIWGQGMAVLHYLHRRDPQDRERVAKDDQDFEAFYGQYVQFATTGRASALAKRLREDYDQFRRLGANMMAKRDRLDELIIAARNDLKRVDDLINREVRGSALRPEALGRLPLLLALQTKVADLGLAAASHHSGALDVERSNAQRYIEEAQRVVVALKQPSEPPAWARLRQGSADVIRALAEVGHLESQLQDDSRAFAALRKQMDDVLDDEIQSEAVGNLTALRAADSRATNSVMVAAGLLMPAFLVSAALVGVVLIRSITEPVQRLMAGAGAVRQGDLSYRILPSGDSELATLAREFNRMVATLEGTTVSKASLEKAHMRLHEMIGELRTQTAGRKRAEEEQARLQAVVRRSEILSALGSVVAGVAHEVRNPLFAISSTVDALEARAQHDEAGNQYEPHIRVLRVELGRLSMLMRDLLDYGRPPSIHLADSPVAAVVNASIETCSSAAAAAGTQVVTTIEPEIDQWPMDRAGLEQVLRNMLENAIQHSAGGTVHLNVRRVDRDGSKMLRMEVLDDGPGFDPGELAHVFEPFFSRRPGGTGLGLSIVERIVLAHDGAVFAANAAPRGAQITIDLPLASEPPSAPEAGRAL